MSVLTPREHVDTKTISDEAGFASLELGWRKLVDAAPDATPFQTWEWVSAWRRHFPQGTPSVLVARSGPDLVGVMPLVETRYRGLPVRQLRWMGAPLSDVQGVLAAPSHSVACAKAFLRRLRELRDRWDLVDLADVPEASPLAGLPASWPLRVTTEVHRRCPYLQLPASFPSLLGTLSKKMRTKTRYYRRRLKREFGAEYDLATTQTLDAAMQELFALHSARWKRRGTGGAFASPVVREFHLDVARRFVERGWLRLARVRMAGVTRATLYAFRLGGRTSYYLSGFDPTLARYSIGHDLLAYSIETAIADGDTEYDFLRGEETYKYDWSARDRHTVRLILEHPTVRSRMASGIHKVERRIEHLGLGVQRRIWGHRKREA